MEKCIISDRVVQIRISLPKKFYDDLLSVFCAQTLKMGSFAVGGSHLEEKEGRTAVAITFPESEEGKIYLFFNEFCKKHGMNLTIESLI
jgi:hypothetical protein